MSARIGLEVHVPLHTRSKLFCACPTDPSEEPNTRICPTCTGQPGARPQGMNRRAVELALETAHLLHSRTVREAVVQRKHYVYPDLPNNYQRTTTPVGEDGRFWDVGIREVHLEEDPGAYDPDEGVVDLDRSGTPLVEIVTEPDLEDARSVDDWIAVLRLALERSGILRPGAELKADVNVSTAGGERVEVKNVVGGRNAARAVAFELDRQTEARSRGEAISMQTRHFDETKGTTRASRTKETVGDYRYMPDPDLHPIDLAVVEGAVASHEDIPARLVELTEAFDLELGEAIALLEDATLEALFEELRAEVSDDLAVDVALRRLRSELEYRDASLESLEVDPGLVVDLAVAWDQDKITKHVFTRLLRDALDGESVREQLEAETEAGVDLDAVVQTVIDENEQAVADYESGKHGAIDYLVGQVLAKTQGRADPKQVRTALAKRLDP